MASTERFRSQPLWRAAQWTLAVSLSYAGAMGSVFADQTIPVTAVNPPDAAIECLEATGQLLEYQAVPSRVGVSRHTQMKSVNIKSAQFAHWEGRIRYRNSSTRPVTAVRFQWKLLDVFDQPQWVVEVTDSEALAPRETREGRWEQQVSNVDEVVKALLTVKMVRFQDGTLWFSSPQEIQTPEPDEAVRSERKRLLKLYDDRGIEALLEALHE